MEKNKSDLISVIMACYNEKIEWVEQSIQSILNQTYSNIEFIIVCDNPNYNQLKETLIKYRNSDKRVKLIINERNIGLISSLNLALRNCNGKYVARMDSDDISCLDRFEKEITYLEHTKSDFVMSGSYFINENGQYIGCTKNKKISFEKLKKKLFYRNCSIHPTWLFKIDILNNIKGYDDVLYCEDYDFLCRSILNGYHIEYIQEPLIYYRFRNNSISRSKRYYQEITSQAVSTSYYNALRLEKLYNPSGIVEKLTDEDIEEFKNQNEKFKEGKSLIKQGKVIIGMINLLEVLIKSKLKRRQLINNVLFKLII